MKNPLPLCCFLFIMAMPIRAAENTYVQKQEVEQVTAAELWRVVPSLQQEKGQQRQENLKNIADALAILSSEEHALAAAPDKDTKEDVPFWVALKGTMEGNSEKANALATFTTDVNGRAILLCAVAVAEIKKPVRDANENAQNARKQKAVEAAWLALQKADAETRTLNGAALAILMARLGNRPKANAWFDEQAQFIRALPPRNKDIYAEFFAGKTSAQVSLLSSRLIAGFDVDLKAFKSDENIRNGLLTYFISTADKEQAFNLLSELKPEKAIKEIADQADLNWPPQSSTEPLDEKTKNDRLKFALISWHWCLEILEQVKDVSQRARFASRISRGLAYVGEAENALRLLSREIKPPRLQGIESEVKFAALMGTFPAEDKLRVNYRQWAREFAEQQEKEWKELGVHDTIFDWQSVVKLWLLADEPSKARRAAANAERLFPSPPKIDMPSGGWGKKIPPDEVMNEAINADEMAKMAVIWKSVGDEKRADDWVRRAVRVSFGVNRNLCDTLIDGGYYTQAAQIAIREKDDSGIERIARRQALRFGGNPPEWILNIAAPSLRAKALISWAHAISPVMEYMIYMMSDALGVK